MAADKPSLADKMKPKATPPSASTGGPPGSVSSHFKTPGEEYPKRLTLDLTVAQHRKLKLRAMDEGLAMNQILRDFIDALAD